jgi:hypothetical protein
MRDFRDAKAMARALRHALKAKAIKITHSESLELIAKAFGYGTWNILSAKIDAGSPRGGECSSSPARTQTEQASPKILYCSFCGKSQREVRKLIAGPGALFICDECVELCTDILDPGDDRELFRLMKGRLKQGLVGLIPVFLHNMERARKGTERNRFVLQGLQRRLAMSDDEVSAGDDISGVPRYLMDKPREELVALQQKAQRELKRYEDALRIATTVLSMRLH